jgi:hypothetical protein
LFPHHINMSSGDTTYYKTVCSVLPTDHAERVKALCTSTSAEAVIDSLIRFVIGAECFSDTPADSRKEWDEKQLKARKALDELQRPSDSKRVREEDESGSQSAKRQRRLLNEAGELDVPPQDDPLFALHSISATSPVRKKVDITIHKSSIRFTHPSTHTIEAVVLLSDLQRAFILPTRGRSRPYWTVVLLSSDSQNGGTAASSNLQVIFGIDAQLLAPASSTTYTPSSPPSTKTISKGSATLPLLHNFLSHLPTHALPVLEPSTAVFRSACANAGSGSEGGGIPGTVAYRAAKAGNLWFFKEGILWGDSKPCEFWSVEDLINKTDGVKLVSATGRTCSVILTRKTSEDGGQASSGADGDDGDDGVETEFGMVDGREQPGINQWVRQHRHLFGKKKVVEKARGETNNAAKVAPNATEADSDDSDEDFEVNSDDEDGGSPSSASSDESASASGGGSEGDAEESGSDVEDEGELRVENHPLLRPGAMPRMSRAAIDAVVGMMEEDLADGHEGEASNGEEDELDD